MTTSSDEMRRLEARSAEGQQQAGDRGSMGRSERGSVREWEPTRGPGSTILPSKEGGITPTAIEWPRPPGPQQCKCSGQLAVCRQSPGVPGGHRGGTTEHFRALVGEQLKQRATESRLDRRVKANRGVASGQRVKGRAFVRRAGSMPEPEAHASERRSVATTRPSAHSGEEMGTNAKGPQDMPSFSCHGWVCTQETGRPGGSMRAERR